MREDALKIVAGGATAVLSLIYVAWIMFPSINVEYYSLGEKALIVSPFVIAIIAFVFLIRWKVRQPPRPPKVKVVHRKEELVLSFMVIASLLIFICIALLAGFFFFDENGYLSSNEELFMIGMVTAFMLPIIVFYVLKGMKYFDFHKEGWKPLTIPKETPSQKSQKGIRSAVVAIVVTIVFLVSFQTELPRQMGLSPTSFLIIGVITCSIASIVILFALKRLKPKP